MKLTYSKNIQFTKLIKVKDRLREFNFRKPNNRPDSIFTVDVIDDYGGRIVFHMANDNNEWVIQPQDLPDWIKEKEPVLNEIIKDMLSA